MPLTYLNPMFEALKNIFKPSDERRALEFWTWFFANEQHYRNIDEDGPEERDHRVKVFLDHLAPYHQELTFVTGTHADGKHELIISADGIQRHFKAAEDLVRAAPELKTWRFIALKPPQPDFGPLQLNGKTFDVNELQFARVQGNKGELNIVIFHPAYAESEQELHVVATYLLLDSLLGERSVTEDINGLNVKPNSVDVPKNVLRPLRVLPTLVAENKCRE